MLRVRDRAADMPAAEALKFLGDPMGWEPEALVPLPGPARLGWADRKTFEAISRAGDFMTLQGAAGDRVLDAVDREVVRRLVEEPLPEENLARRTYGLRSDVTNRVVDFMKDGSRLDERVAAESEMLERQSSRVIADRFRDTPIVSLVPLPDRGEARRAWIEDTLRAEHAAARAGLMDPAAVVSVAQARRGSVPFHWEPAPLMADRSRALHAEIEREAAQIERMSDASLKSRFRDVPGMGGASLPEVGRGDERRIWIETAITAQKVREAMPPRNGTVLDITRTIAKRDVVSHDRSDRSDGRGPLPPRSAPARAHSFAITAMMQRA